MVKPRTPPPGKAKKLTPPPGDYYTVNPAGKKVPLPPGQSTRNKKYNAGTTDKKKAAPPGRAKKQGYKS